MSDSYVPTFGGPPANPAQASLAVFTVSGTLALEWPSGLVDSYSGTATTIEVSSPNSASLINLPRGDMGSDGAAILFNNVGSNDIAVRNFSGDALYTLAAGQSRYTYLRDNTTSGGSWRNVIMGAVTVAPDAAALASNGLRAANGTQLQTVEAVTSINSNYTATANDHAALFAWAGGAGSFTLPAGTLLWNGYYVDANNDGTGTLTFQTSDGSTIDGASTLALLQDESVRLVWTGTKWLTFARGRSTTFSVTTLTKSLAGSGNVNLVTAEVAAQIQTFTGILTGARTVTYGSTPNFYFVNNSTSGAYDTTFRAISGDPGVIVTQGISTILRTDGASMRYAINSGAGTVTLINTAARLTGGPITTSGTLDLATVAGTPGTYGVLTGTVDAYGRLLNAGESAAALTVSGNRTMSSGLITLSGGRIRASWTEVACTNPMFLDLSSGQNFSVTLTGSPMIVALNGDEGQGGAIRLIHAGPSFTPTFSSTATSGFRSPASTGTPAFSTVSGARDIVSYLIDSTSPLRVDILSTRAWSGF